MPSHNSSPNAAERSARVAASFAFGLQGFTLAMLLTQLPSFRDVFGLSDTTIVAAVVTTSVVAALGSVLAELLAAGVGSKTTAAGGLILVAVSAAGIGLAPTVPLFFTGFVVYGIGLGMVDAAANMQAVDIQHRYGRSILSSFHAAWSGGAILGALFVSAFDGLGVGLRPTVLVAAAVVLVGTLVLRPKLLDSALMPAPAVAEERLVIPRGPFLALGAAMALFFAIDFSISNWSALYLTDVLFTDLGTAALGIAVYQAAALGSRLTGDLWVRRFDEIAVVRVGAGIAVVGLLIVVAAQSPAMAIAGFLIVGLGAPVVAPLCFSAAGQLAPPGQTDTVIARLNLFNYAGTVIGGGLVGAVAAVSDLRIGFLLPLAFAVGLALLAPAFRPAIRQPQR